MRQHRIALLTP
ncbi:hypothetical protein EM73_012165 [Vibrio parahaemolyticus]|nr:hypothetical protein EM73_012165 [Vibrio parahaemolyticus]